MSGWQHSFAGIKLSQSTAHGVFDDGLMKWRRRRIIIGNDLKLHRRRRTGELPPGPSRDIRRCGTSVGPRAAGKARDVINAVPTTGLVASSVGRHNHAEAALR